MALMRWDDEEDKKDESGIKRIASVQSGWQPAPSGANSAVATNDITTRPSGGGVFGQTASQPEPVKNYLMSEEKAKSDEQRRIQRAREAEARRIAAANAAAQAQARAAAQYQQQQQQTNAAPNVDEAARQRRIAELEAQYANENKGLGGFFNRNIRDKFDANSTRDRLARLKAQTPEMFQEEQKVMARDNVQSVATNPFKRIFEDVVEAPRRVGTALARNTDDAKSATESQEKLTQVEDDLIAKAQAKIQDPSVSDEEKLRWHNLLVKIAPQIQQDQYDRQIQMAKDAKDDDPAAVAAAIAEMGLDIGTLGMGGVAFKGAKSAAKLGTKELGQYFGKNIVKPVLPAIGGGGVGAVTSQGSDVTPEQIALGAAAGGGLGLVLPLAGAGTGRILRPFNPNKLSPEKALDGVIDAPVRVPEPVLNGSLSETSSLLPMDREIPRISIEDTNLSRAGEDIGTNEPFSTVIEDAKAPEPIKTPVYDQSVADIGNPDKPFTSQEYDLLKQLNEQRATAELSPELETVRQRLQAKKDAITSTPEVTPVPATAPAKVTPVAEGAAQVPVLPTEQVKALQDSIPGKSQADEAEINQKIQELDPDTPSIKSTETEGVAPKTPPVEKTLEDATDNATPTTTPVTTGTKIPVTSEPPSNLPPGMGGDTPVTPKPKKTITPEQKTINEFAKRVFSNTDLHKDFKKRLARALGLDKDTESSVPELLASTDRKVSARDKAAIESKFAELEKVANEYNGLMKSQRKGYQKSKTAGLDEAASKRANKLIETYGRIERDLNSHVRKIQGKSSIGNRLANAAENLVGARNASILTSVGGVSRNITQELGANILDTFLHPVKMAKASVRMPAEIIRSYKKAAREFTVTPKTVSEFFPYAIGNTYRTLMSPVTGMANVRKIVARESIAESLLRAQGENPTRAEIKKFAAAMGADSEVVANNMMGILNGMTSHGKGLEVMRAYQEFIKTGSAEAKETFLNNTEKSSNLAAKLTQVAASSDNPSQRLGIALANTVFPFVNTATNLAKTAVTYNLNPLSRSINDEILKAVRNNPENTLAILKNKAANYIVLGGVFALYQQGVIGYNDGEDVSKPRGIYIHKGGDDYFAVRATPIELPIAAVVTAAEIARDVAEGNPRPVNYYAGILGNSLPYVDSATNLAAATGSAVQEYLGGDISGGTGDNGYAAKSYAVNTAKSFVPYSNNGLTPAINNAQGKSTNAKTVYDKNPVTWFKQAVGASYPTGYRDRLKDSRDPAGRVRTVDQQGIFTINKTINDKNTAEFNDPINKLVKYARDTGLGKNTKDMFNTYDTGKNNNFKSVQDKITFLGAVDGKPDNAKKLEKDERLTDFAQQIRNGYFGDTENELFTLDGETIKSDVSVPNKAGTKNSKLPLNMASIRNAIAQVDLSDESWDELNAIRERKNELYDMRKNQKTISYDQEQEAKAELAQRETQILSTSPNYQKLNSLMTKLDETGFFEADGLGSTRAGQTYLWNALNALLGSKGATPAANYPETDKAFTPWGRGGGSGGKKFGATNKPGDRGSQGIKWTPVQARQMAKTKKGTYKPFKATVKLGNAVKKDKTQNYESRNF